MDTYESGNDVARGPLRRDQAGVTDSTLSAQAGTAHRCR